MNQQIFFSPKSCHLQHFLPLPNKSSHKKRWSQFDCVLLALLTVFPTLCENFLLWKLMFVMKYLQINVQIQPNEKESVTLILMLLHCMIFDIQARGCFLKLNFSSSFALVITNWWFLLLHTKLFTTTKEAASIWQWKYA